MPVTISVTGCSTWIAGVHLDEVELLVLVQELEGPGAAVVDPAARLDAALADARALPRGDVGRRRLLDHLLVTALHRAIALAEIDALPRCSSASTWTSMWRGVSRYFSR